MASRARKPKHAQARSGSRPRAPSADERLIAGSAGLAIAVRDWLDRVGERPLFIEPGSPWENGYIESFNGRLREELRDGEIFYAVKESQVLTEWWLQEYNQIQPHSALGYRPPAPEAIEPLPFRRESFTSIQYTASA